MALVGQAFVRLVRSLGTHTVMDLLCIYVAEMSALEAGLPGGAPLDMVACGTEAPLGVCNVHGVELAV